jgi:hypothetical protein
VGCMNDSHRGPIHTSFSFAASAQCTNSCKKWFLRLNGLEGLMRTLNLASNSNPYAKKGFLSCLLSIALVPTRRSSRADLSIGQKFESDVHCSLTRKSKQNAFHFVLSTVSFLLKGGLGNHGTHYTTEKSWFPTVIAILPPW